MSDLLLPGVLKFSAVLCHQSDEAYPLDSFPQLRSTLLRWLQLPVGQENPPKLSFATDTVELLWRRPERKVTFKGIPISNGRYL